MVAYRRYYIKGGTWFFTVNLKDRRSMHLTENIELLRYSVAV
ncbi:TPA: transposase, partial [Klebsiella pneumoniae]|nr:transposase [Klebsiella pneumoniae]